MLDRDESVRRCLRETDSSRQRGLRPTRKSTLRLRVGADEMCGAHFWPRFLQGLHQRVSLLAPKRENASRLRQLILRRWDSDEILADRSRKFFAHRPCYGCGP